MAMIKVLRYQVPYKVSVRVLEVIKSRDATEIKRKGTDITSFSKAERTVVNNGLDDDDGKDNK